MEWMLLKDLAFWLLLCFGQFWWWSDACDTFDVDRVAVSVDVVKKQLSNASHTHHLLLFSSWANANLIYCSANVSCMV